MLLALRAQAKSVDELAADPVIADMRAVELQVPVQPSESAPPVAAPTLAALLTNKFIDEMWQAHNRELFDTDDGNWTAGTEQAACDLVRQRIESVLAPRWTELEQQAAHSAALFKMQPCPTCGRAHSEAISCRDAESESVAAPTLAALLSADAVAHAQLRAIRTYNTHHDHSFTAALAYELIALLAPRWTELEQQAAQQETRAAQAEQQATWQPIETAEKDGRCVLVYPVPVFGADQAGAAYWDRDADYESWRDLRDGERLDPQPTHWMPLPNPPSDVPGGSPSQETT